MPHYLRNKLNRFALESNCAGSSSITKSSRSRSHSRSRREAACHTCHRCSLGADVRGVASGGRCPSIYIYSIVCVIYENHTLTHTHTCTLADTLAGICVSWEHLLCRRLAASQDNARLSGHNVARFKAT